MTPIRGQWTLYPVRSEQIKVAESDDHDHAEWVIRVDGPLPPHPVQACPVPDEAAIERATRVALAEMERRDLWHTTPDGYDVGMNVDVEDAAAVARAVLRAALEPTETP